MLRKLGKLLMLHYGTHPLSGLMACSRSVSIGSWKTLMMLSLSSSGPHLSGQLGRLR